MHGRLGALGMAAFWLLSCSRAPAAAMDPGMMDRHMVPIPETYAPLTSPIAADSDSLARGQVVYEANCAVCHGSDGWGNGPAASSLIPPPAPLAHTAPMLSDAYLFYRVSEGGGIEPFNSAMPAWKAKLSETQRWDVINYVRSLANGGMMRGSPMLDGLGRAGWMWLSMLAVVGLLVTLIGALVWASRWAHAAKAAEEPLETLKRRLARGEITLEQFEAIKRQLEAK